MSPDTYRAWLLLCHQARLDPRFPLLESLNRSRACLALAGRLAETTGFTPPLPHLEAAYDSYHRYHPNPFETHPAPKEGPDQ